MIKPTIGRVVWYWSKSLKLTIGQPQAALIAWVISEHRVNLAVFDANGHAYNRTDVLLFDGEGSRPECEFCEWMPYQLGQAKKELHPVERIQPIEVGPQG